MSPYGLSPIPGPKIQERRGLAERFLGVRSVPDLGTLTTSIASTSDAPIVQRTWGLLGGSSAYGPKFQFKEFMRTRNYVTGVFVHLALTILPAFLLIKPLRSLLKRFVFAPGEGADEAAQAKERIEYRAIAKPDMDNPTSHAFSRVRYNGKGGIYYCE